MYILGISSYYHDSAAVLIKDGKVIFAVEEERFTRIKHDNNFPINAIKFCLHEANINISDIYVAYYEKPLLKFERILETFMDTYPRSLKPFIKGIPEWFSYKIKVGSVIKKQTGYTGQILYVPHHLAHAAAAFLTSNFKKAAVLTIDGVGDYPTTEMWIGEKDSLMPIKVMNFPHSLGLMYSTFTSFLGFKVNNDEYKVMGLSAYGKATFRNKILNTINLKKDGSFQLNMDYYSFRESFVMYSKKFEKVFGPPRIYGGKITKRDMDLAASLQSVTEEIYFRILNNLYLAVGSSDLCIGGGVALNSLANGKIYEKTPFKNIHVLGAAGDSGAALGAALFVHNKINNTNKRFVLKNLYLGGEDSDKDIEKVLKKYKLNYFKTKSENELIAKTALALSKNKIVGWYQGRMEFGPRALGARSILANPRLRKMKDEVNNIKRREEFRPFAASVLQENVSDLFEVPENNHYSPFMNFCFMVKPKKKKLIAAVVHEDNTCRIQTVNKDNGIYYNLISEFYKITGIPCILNTSYNLAIEPIVSKPSQAIMDFMETSMDHLAIGSYFVSKSA